MALDQASQLFIYTLLTPPFLTYYAIASDLIVLPGQGGLMIVTVQVPSCSRSWRREKPLSEEKKTCMLLLLLRICSHLLELEKIRI